MKMKQQKIQPNPTQLHLTQFNSSAMAVKIVEEFLFCHSIKRIDWLKSLKHVRAPPPPPHTDIDTDTHNRIIIKYKIRKKIVSLSQCACVAVAILLLTVSTRLEFAWDGIRQEFAIWWQIRYKCDGPKVAFFCCCFCFSNFFSLLSRPILLLLDKTSFQIRYIKQREQYT